MEKTEIEKDLIKLLWSIAKKRETSTGVEIERTFADEAKAIIEYFEPQLADASKLTVDKEELKELEDKMISELPVIPRYDIIWKWIMKNIISKYQPQINTEDKWISVETPPKKSGRYIVYDSNLFGNPENTIETLRYDAAVDGWFELSDRYHPQFWMPLPKSPLSK